MRNFSKNRQAHFLLSESVLTMLFVFLLNSAGITLLTNFCYLSVGSTFIRHSDVSLEIVTVCVQVQN